MAFVPPPLFFVIRGVSVSWVLLAAVVILGLACRDQIEVGWRARWLMMAFVALLAVSALRGGDPDGGLWFLSRLILSILAGLLFSRAGVEHALVIGAVARVACEAVFTAVQSGDGSLAAAKLGDAGSHHLVLAGLLLPITILAIGGLGPRPRVTATVLVAALALTRSRAALAALAVGLVVLATMRSNRWRRAAYAVGAVIVGAATVLAVRMTWSDAVWSVSPRVEYARTSVDLIFAHPWLGIGWGSFASALRDLGIEPLAVDPHNLFLHIAVEAGLPAMLVFVTFLWTLRQRETEWAAVIAILVNSFFVSFYIDWPIFWVLLFARRSRLAADE
ncbi:MAG: O-antigen ligase family protein [Acidobacteria bacterium]|nr:O-antigen ligase family protein [Acidobacteriota bacterium]